MKTIDEILKRDDYRKLVPALRSRTQEIARLIREKMLDLAEDYITFNGINLYIVQSRTNCGPYEYLAIDEENSDLLYCLDGAFSGYIHGDFNHPCYAASNNRMLDFLNNAKGIIEMLDEIETKKVKSITEALKNVEEL